MTMKHEPNFTKSWTIENLGDVIDIKGGSQPPKSEFIYEPADVLVFPN